MLNHNANQLLNVWLSDVKENNKDMKLIEQPLLLINDIDNNNQTNNNKSSSSSSINDNNRRNSNFNNSINNSSSNRNNNNEELKSMKIFNFRKFLSVIYYKNVYRFTGNMIINKIRNWKEIVKKSCKRFIYLIDVKKIGNSSSGSSSNHFYHTTDELDMIINEYEMKMSIDLLNDQDDDDDDNDDESKENDVDVINIYNNNKTNYTNGTDNDATNNNDHTDNMMKKDKSLTKEYNRLIPRINRLVAWRDHCLVTKIESEPTTIQIMKTVEVPAILLHPISMKGRRRSVMDVFDDDNEEDKCKL